MSSKLFKNYLEKSSLMIRIYSLSVIYPFAALSCSELFWVVLDLEFSSIPQSIFLPIWKKKEKRMENVDGQQFSGYVTDLSLGFDSAIPKYKPSFSSHSFVVFALCFCSLSCWNIYYHSDYQQMSGWLEQVCLNSLLIFDYMYWCLWWKQASLFLLLKSKPEHDATTNMLCLHQPLCLGFRPNASSLDSSDHEHFCSIAFRWSNMTFLIITSLCRADDVVEVYTGSIHSWTLGHFSKHCPSCPHSQSW